MGHSCRTFLWDTLAAHFLGTFLIPQIIPLTSDTLRLPQRVSRFAVARRRANALSTKAAQIPMANGTATSQTSRRHTVCPDTIEANMSHDTTNHPAHQRRAVFTSACFALPSGTAPRKRTLHQGRANPNGTATSRTSCRRTVCPYTRIRSKHVT